MLFSILISLYSFRESTNECFCVGGNQPFLHKNIWPFFTWAAAWWYLNISLSRPVMWRMNTKPWTCTKQSMTHTSSISKDEARGGIVGQTICFLMQTLFTLSGEVCDKVSMLSSWVVAWCCICWLIYCHLWFFLSLSIVYRKLETYMFMCKLSFLHWAPLSGVDAPVKQEWGFLPKVALGMKVIPKKSQVSKSPYWTLK